MKGNCLVGSIDTFANVNHTLGMVYLSRSSLTNVLSGAYLGLDNATIRNLTWFNSFALTSFVNYVPANCELFHGEF